MNKIMIKTSEYLMFREGTEEEADGSLVPILTTGSIIWGVLLRSAIIIFSSFLIIEIFDMRQYWWFFFLLFWFFAAYPGWRQFQKFQERIKKVSEDTLCGSCRNFESSSQLCKILDEHVTKEYIPCEGLSWEPKSYEDGV